MKRANVNEPSTSTGKRARPGPFTSQQVIDLLNADASDEDEFDANYPAGSSDEEESDDSRSSDSRRVVMPRPRGRGTRTTDRGDADHVDLDDGWTNVFRPSVDLQQFVDNGVGPQNLPDYISNESNPIEFLDLFFDNEFWENIVRMTNLRASQVHRDKPNNYYAKNFSDVSVEGMKGFIGLRIYMEYLCVKPSYRDYWNSEGSDFVGFMPGFRQVFTRDRFLAIWTHLHVIDEEDAAVDKTDKIYKVHPMLNDLLLKFGCYYKPHQHLSLDEGMIPCKNRLAIKQYIRDKPVKWGIKSFLLCDAETGYVMNVEIYTGTAEIIDATIGVVGNTVIRLLTSAHLENLGHILVMDRYYNSVILSHHLQHKQKTGVVGTLMTNRKHLPKTLKVKKLPNRGDYRYKCRESVTCLVWQDRKPIHFVSNYHDPEEVSTVNRRNKDGTVTEIPIPQLVKDYNSFMGGCDKNDQLTRLNRSRRHYRWPRRLLIKFFMWACYNSYVLCMSRNTKHTSFKKYIQNICLALIGDYRSPSRLSLRHQPGEQRFTPGNHFPEMPPGTTKDHVCAVCSEKHNRYKAANPGVKYKDNPHKLSKTIVWCSFCHHYLCVKRDSTCWADWHTKAQYWR